MAKPADISEIRGSEDFAKAFSVSRETLVKLDTYANLLKSWQKTINLVAPSTLDHIWHRHFADSAQLVRLALATSKSPSNAPLSERALHWLDLGSGAGFPGLVVAILLAEQSPNSRVTLVESDQRKAAFLGEVARATRVTVDILCTRIEMLAIRSKLAPVDVVSARALKALPELLDLAYPFFAPATLGLFLKGREAENEIDQALVNYEFSSNLVPSFTSSDGRVILLRALRPRT